MFHHAAEAYAKYIICACKLIGLIYLVAPLWGVPLHAWNSRFIHLAPAGDARYNLSL